jgi:Ran GTPase-activating protein (RanGAP) involved in mRNA processing and transport
MGLTEKELEAIQCPLTIECWLGFRDLTAQDAYQLSRCKNSVRKLNLNGNNITDVGLKYILSSFTSLQELNVAGNSITDVGIQYLVDYLTKHKQMTSLCLLGNQITCHGASLLATVLPSLHLNSLYLYMNSIGDHGALSIITALQDNKHLETLWLDHNLISLKGAQKIIHALSKNTSITSIELTVYHDSILLEDKEFLYQIMQRNTEIQSQRLGIAKQLLKTVRKFLIVKTPLPNELLFHLFSTGITVFTPVELITIITCLLNRETIGKFDTRLTFSGSELVRQCWLINSS